MSWSSLPHHLLEAVFLQLDITDCYQCLLVCYNWHHVFEYDYIWKKLFVLNYEVPLSTPLRPSATSWQEEFKRLRYHCPTQCAQVQATHTDEVLHCAWSPDGKYIATSSKDKFVLIWTADNNSLHHYETVPRQDSWQYCQKCIFNESSTLLLVSGTLNQDNQGEIIIYNMQKRKLLPYIRILNMPYDVFGAWITPGAFVVGERGEDEGAARFKVIDGLSNVVPSETTVHLSKYTQESQFTDNIRTLCVADVTLDDKKHNKALVFSRAVSALVAHQVVVKYVRYSASVECDGGRLSANNGPENNTVSELSREEELTRVDHKLNLHASIIGLAVGQNKVYVNCRSWLEEHDDQTVFHYFPKISDKIELRIYSLQGLQHITTMSTATAHTAADSFFFIHLNLSPSFIASGDEGRGVHVFDRHYKIPLAQLSQHNDVVNAAAVNPDNENEMVSVSDDGKVCYWVSRDMMSRGSHIESHTGSHTGSHMGASEVLCMATKQRFTTV